MTFLKIRWLLLVLPGLTDYRWTKSYTHTLYNENNLKDNMRNTYLEIETVSKIKPRG